MRNENRKRQEIEITGTLRVTKDLLYRIVDYQMRKYADEMSNLLHVKAIHEGTETKYLYTENKASHSISKEHVGALIIEEYFRRKLKDLNGKARIKLEGIEKIANIG